VIASLPAGVYGAMSAATAPLSLLSSLPQIGILVEIGGGIASGCVSLLLLLSPRLDQPRKLPL